MKPEPMEPESEPDDDAAPKGVIESAPPMKDRPICRWCGKRLKPHYETEKGRAGRESTRKVEPGEMMEIIVGGKWLKGDPTNEHHHPDHRHSSRYVNGHWWFYWEAESIKSRRFTGHYGYYDLFCNATHCAVAWARANVEDYWTAWQRGLKTPAPSVSKEYNRRADERAAGKEPK
jgi:hypothetical protein